MRKALFFGSFNPLHYGHVQIMKYVLESTDAESLTLVLSPHNPLKNSDILSDAKKRLNSLRYAVRCINKRRAINAVEKGLKTPVKPLMVSTVEFNIPAPTYTYNTLLLFRKRYISDNLVLIIGGDNCESFRKWYKWQDILNEFEVWAYPRKGIDTRKFCKEYGIKYLDAPVVDISSTEIRAAKDEKEITKLNNNVARFCTIFE